MKVYRFKLRLNVFDVYEGETFTVTRSYWNLHEGVHEIELTEMGSGSNPLGVWFAEQEKQREVIELNTPSKLKPEARRKLDALPRGKDSENQAESDCRTLRNEL